MHRQTLPVFEFRKNVCREICRDEISQKTLLWLYGADGWCWMGGPLHPPDGQSAAAATALTE